MTPLIALLFLGAVAPPRAAAQSLLADPCAYLQDTRGLAKTECLTKSAELDPVLLREAVQKAPERKRLVREFARRLQAAGPDGMEVTKALLEYDERFSPPLNDRTLAAWLGEDDPLRPSPHAAAAVAAWAHNPPTRPPGPAPADGSRLKPKASVNAIEAGISPEGAARAMDGSQAHPGLDVASLPARPNDLIPKPGPAAAAVPASPRVSDLDIKVPTAPGLDQEIPPLVAPGQEGMNESLLLSIDRAADPCVDFFQYACGKWIKDHPLDGASSWSRTDEIQYRTDSQLKVIFQELAGDKASEPNERKLNDFFSSCSDQKAIEKLGTKPLQPYLSRIDGVADLRGLAGAIAYLHSQGIPAVFYFGAGRDLKNASEVIPQVAQGGINLPREYYLDANHADAIKGYLEEIRAMFALLGEDQARASRDSEAVARLETALARISAPPAQLRDPTERYHRMPVRSLGGLAPSFPWSDYLAAVKAPSSGDLNVSVPKFIEGLDALLARVPLKDWKAYLRWQVLQSTAQDLPKKFGDASKKFNDALYGSSGDNPRWNQCVYEVDDAMGDALGEEYVKRHFDESAKKAITELATAIRTALKDDIEHADWMSPETRAQALEKAAAMTLKVGYPERPRDYSGLFVARGDAFGNARRGAAFAFRKELAGIGHPPDKTAWGMHAQTVNAYYNQANNEIVFPAAILQPPFFNPKEGGSINFGAIGVIIGHEMTHGFDDAGRRYDAKGNMRDWWTKKDADGYESLAQAFVKQYAAYPQAPGQKTPVNGKLTLGENIADNGGMRLAYAAFQRAAGEKRGSDGFTPDQTFFLSFGRMSCGSASDQSLAMDGASDPHAPKRVRVNASVSNMPEFRRAFNCSASSPMGSATPARIW